NRWVSRTARTRAGPPTRGPAWTRAGFVHQARPGNAPAARRAPPRHTRPISFYCSRKGMDTMRRAFVWLTALGLPGTAIGCHSNGHTHGVCDCDDLGHNGHNGHIAPYGVGASPGGALGGAPALRPGETIKEMPKEGDKDKDKDKPAPMTDKDKDKAAPIVPIEPPGN